MITKIQCPAKVNLFLEVTGRRRDGYHDLVTLFAKINLFDSLELESGGPGGVELALDGAGDAPVPAGPDNLVVRAAEAFRKAFRVRAGVKIRLAKGIPVGAGLGGGSSDAAGTLLGLQRLFGAGGLRLTKAQAAARLKRLAAGLGADVAFFLQPAPFCVGRGVGNLLKPVPVAKAPPYMVLVYPGKAVSTRAVYEALPLPSKKGVLTRLAQLGTLQKKLGGGRPIAEWEGLLFNRLEDAVLEAHPEVGQAKGFLARLGARGVLMSGSGSSVFGFAASHEDGERIRGRLQSYPWRVFVTCCLG